MTQEFYESLSSNHAYLYRIKKGLQISIEEHVTQLNTVLYSRTVPKVLSRVSCFKVCTISLLWRDKCLQGR